MLIVFTLSINFEHPASPHSEAVPTGAEMAVFFHTPTSDCLGKRIGEYSEIFREPVTDLVELVLMFNFIFELHWPASPP